MNYSIEQLLVLIHEKISTDHVAQLTVGDLILDRENVEYEVDSKHIQQISELLSSNNLKSEPRLKNGLIKRAIDSTIAIYSTNRDIQTNTDEYRNGLLLMRLAVAMAKVDGVSANEELEIIKELIWNISYLALPEKQSLYAKAIYLFSPRRKYDERARDYVKISLDRQKLVVLVSELSTGAANLVIETAKAIAIADGFLQRSELEFVKDLYRARDLPTRKVKKDIEDYASNRYLNLRTETTPIIEQADELVEAQDVLSDILLDMDDF